MDFLDVTSHGRVTVPKLTGKQVTINLSSHGRVNVVFSKLSQGSSGEIRLGSKYRMSIRSKRRYGISK